MGYDFVVIDSIICDSYLSVMYDGSHPNREPLLGLQEISGNKVADKQEGLLMVTSETKELIERKYEDNCVPIIKNGKGIRKLTPKECFMLQGFPEKFKLPENLADSELYHQAGNSVVVLVVERIAKNIRAVLEGKRLNPQLALS